MLIIPYLLPCEADLNGNGGSGSFTPGLNKFLCINYIFHDMIMQIQNTKCQVKFDINKIRLFKKAVKLDFTYMKESPGTILKRIRISKGYNQTELATRSRVSKNYISLLEADKIVQPRLYQIEKIEKALDLRTGELQSKFTGIASVRPKPTNYLELLEGLESVGITIDWATIGNLENKTEEDFQELFERIQMDTNFSVKRRSQ